MTPVEKARADLARVDQRIAELSARPIKTRGGRRVWATDHAAEIAALVRSKQKLERYIAAQARPEAPERRIVTKADLAGATEILYAGGWRHIVRFNSRSVTIAWCPGTALEEHERVSYRKVERWR